MEARPRTYTVTAAMAISAVALWGLAFPLIRVGLDDFSPVLLGFLRFTLGSALMVAVILIRYPAREVVQTTRREWKSLLALGVLYITIPNIAQNVGMIHGTSSIASVIQSSGPIMTLIFAVILLKEGMTKMKTLGTAVAMTGTLLMVVGGGVSFEDEDFVSNILILISAISYGLAWVSAKRMLERNPPILVIGLSLLIGTALLGLAVPFEPDFAADFTLHSLSNLAVLGFLCGGVSSVLYLSSLEHEEVSKMAFFIYLMPIFASVFAWIILGEEVATWTAICGLIIVIGIAISNRNGSGTDAPEK